MKPAPAFLALAAAILTVPLATASEDSAAGPSTASLETVIRGGALNVPRHVIATGGGRSTGAAWVIRGTIGQVDAEPLQPSTDGSGFYAITGGFWPALPAPRTDGLFIDGFEAQAD